MIQLPALHRDERRAAPVRGLDHELGGVARQVALLIRDHLQLAIVVARIGKGALRDPDPAIADDAVAALVRPGGADLDAALHPLSDADARLAAGIGRDALALAPDRDLQRRPGARLPVQ